MSPRDGTSKCFPGRAELKVLHHVASDLLSFFRYETRKTKEEGSLEDVEDRDMEVVEAGDVFLDELLVQGSH